MDRINHWDKASFTKEMKGALDTVLSILQPFDDAQIWESPYGKWSLAEETLHLIISQKAFNKALLMPKLVFNRFGKPNRPLRNYQEIELRYNEKKQKTGSSLVAPKSFTYQKNTRLTKLQISNWYESEVRKTKLFLNLWSEKRLINTLIPHPLMGRLISKEMLYFIVFHNYYHADSLARKAKNLN